MTVNSVPSERVRRTLEPGAVAVAVIALGGLALRLVLVSRPLRVLDRLFVPDDTYYTLTIARSLAHGHGPTVDGTTLTSGFQPLLGFLMTPVFWLTSSPDLALRIDLVLLVIVDSITILVVAWVARRLAGRVAAVVAAAIWAFSPLAVSMALGGLETSLAILAQVGLVAVWISAREHDDTRHWVVVGVVASLAVLARIDSICLVVLITALQLWRGNRPGLRPAAIAGAVVLAPWWVWCTITFGTPIPTSGAAVHELAPFGSFSRETMTIAAGAVAGGPFGIWGWARDGLVGGWTFGAVVFWVMVVALLVLAGAALRAPSRGTGREARAIAPALPAFAACLLVFYSWFGVTWFFTRYLAPVAWVVTLMIAVAIGALVRTRAAAPARRGLRLLPVIGVAVLTLVVALALRTDFRWLSAERVAPAAAGTPRGYDAGTGYREPVLTILRHVPEGSRIAGWQSGALGYYGLDRTVINLDGAVNPDTAGDNVAELARYLRKRRVEGIADVGLVVARLDLALRSLRPPARSEPVTTAAAASGLAYQYARVVWPARR